MWRRGARPQALRPPDPGRDYEVASGTASNRSLPSRDDVEQHRLGAALVRLADRRHDVAWARAPACGRSTGSRRPAWMPLGLGRAARQRPGSPARPALRRRGPAAGAARASDGARARPSLRLIGARLGRLGASPPGPGSASRRSSASSFTSLPSRQTTSSALLPRRHGRHGPAQLADPLDRLAVERQHDVALLDARGLRPGCPAGPR